MTARPAPAAVAELCSDRRAGEQRDWLSSTGATEDQARSAVPRRNRVSIGKIVVLSLGVGLAAAVLLPFIPWPTFYARFATAIVLLGFGVGWALLAALSMREVGVGASTVNPRCRRAPASWGSLR